MRHRPYDSEGDDAARAMAEDREAEWQTLVERLSAADARQIVEALTDAERLIAAVNMKAATFATRRMHDAAKLTVGTALGVIRQKGSPR